MKPLTLVSRVRKGGLMLASATLLIGWTGAFESSPPAAESLDRVEVASALPVPVPDPDPDLTGSPFSIRSITVESRAEGPRAVVSLHAARGHHYRLLGTDDLGRPRELWTEFHAFQTDSEAPVAGLDLTLPPSVIPQLDRMFFTVEVAPR